MDGIGFWKIFSAKKNRCMKVGWMVICFWDVFFFRIKNRCMKVGVGVIFVDPLDWLGWALR